MGEISIKEHGKPLSKNGRRYKVNQLPIILRCYILALGRVPTQMEVRSDPKMPSLDTFFNVYPDWETAIRAAGFEMHWCSQEMREKLLNDLWRKYRELDYRLPGLLDIQDDPDMEKVCVYTQIFEDLRCAWIISGVWDDYRKRERKKIVTIIVNLRKKLGRTPTMRDAGMPRSRTINEFFGSYNEALKMAGLKPNHQEYTKQELIRQLKLKNREIGRIPTAADFNNDPGMASAQTFRKRFGTFENALKAAGLLAAS
ncbi:hypothetical protein IIW29_01555 [Candidatus Saccharibacteria bacterium]|nr:hypothetical protein [Candidatus Saccharibacteria bacterium]